jgi:hypothetical protein
MGNLDIWDKFSMPPEWALRRISGGRLNGKTDINPQWRMRAMTEAFGPCGIGWKYTIDKLWSEPGADGQVMAMALVSVCLKSGENWSEPIHGIGGSMLVEKESRGLYTSDEGYKMAVTDALSVAFKALGVAADIYQGDAWQSKYMRSASTTIDDYNALLSEAAKNKGKEFTPYKEIKDIPEALKKWADEYMGK